MRNRNIIFATAYALAWATPASAEPCHLTTPAAIVCIDPANAGRAFSVFGAAPREANGQYLRQFGCGFPFAAPSYKVEVMEYGTIPLPRDSVRVATVTLNGGYYYVAAAFLTGDCAIRPRKVPTVEMPPL